MEIRFNKEKNLLLQKVRRIRFEQIKEAIDNGFLLGVIELPNKEKYPKQKILLVEVQKYVYLVPFVEESDYLFLKTVIPSRKFTKKLFAK